MCQIIIRTVKLLYYPVIPFVFYMFYDFKGFKHFLHDGGAALLALLVPVAPLLLIFTGEWHSRRSSDAWSGYSDLARENVLGVKTKYYGSVLGLLLVILAGLGILIGSALCLLDLLRPVWKESLFRISMILIGIESVGFFSALAYAVHENYLIWKD